MPQQTARALIQLKDIKNRTFLIAADSIVSFKSMPGDNTYVIQMSNGAEITLVKEQCDKIVNSSSFKINKSRARSTGW